jgi:Protein of unknown function (DUF3307)
MLTADQVVCHLVGDYVLQSDWMAQTKTQRSWPAIVHAVTYTLPFLVLSSSWTALGVIAGSHFVIDRWRLARYICWVKNQVAPASARHPWAESRATGYHDCNLIRQWFNAVHDTHPAYLTPADHALAQKIQAARVVHECAAVMRLVREARTLAEVMVWDEITVRWSCDPEDYTPFAQAVEACAELGVQENDGGQP